MFKKCGKCKVYSSVSNFGPSRTAKDRLYYYCKACQRNNDRRYYAQNGAKKRAQSKVWSAANKEYRLERYRQGWFYYALMSLSRRQKLCLLPGAREELISYLETVLSSSPYCKYTGLELTPAQKNISLDHIMPIARGGRTLDPNNLQLVAYYYNYSKREMTEEEFLPIWKQIGIHIWTKLLTDEERSTALASNESQHLKLAS